MLNKLKNSTAKREELLFQGWAEADLQPWIGRHEQRLAEEKQGLAEEKQGLAEEKQGLAEEKQRLAEDSSAKQEQELGEQGNAGDVPPIGEGARESEALSTAKQSYVEVSSAQAEVSSALAEHALDSLRALGSTRTAEGSFYRTQLLPSGRFIMDPVSENELQALVSADGDVSSSISQAAVQSFQANVMAIARKVAISPDFILDIVLLKRMDDLRLIWLTMSVQYE